MLWSAAVAMPRTRRAARAAPHAPRRTRRAAPHAPRRTPRHDLSSPLRCSSSRLAAVPTLSYFPRCNRGVAARQELQQCGGMGWLPRCCSSRAVARGFATLRELQQHGVMGRVAFALPIPRFCSRVAAPALLLFPRSCRGVFKWELHGQRGGNGVIRAL